MTRHVSRILHNFGLSTQHEGQGLRAPARSTIICALCAAAVLLAACQPGEATPESLPTLAVLPSLTPTEESTAVPTETETAVATAEPSATDTSEPTETSQPTKTPAQSNTPRPVITSTRIPPPTEVPTSAPTVATPVFSTFTPLPPGTLPPPGTPQQFAGVVITRVQFQDAVNAKIPDYPTIQAATVSFAPDGIHVQLTAMGGQAFITGEVFLSVEVSNGVAAITPADITVNAAEPPDAYVEVVNTDFFLMMVDALDTILKERLGPEQDLENIVFSGDNMQITLLVPKTG
jgi:hypothetical protein